jgi:hypothetical protein
MFKKLVDYVRFYATKSSFNSSAYVVFSNAKNFTKEDRNFALVSMNSSCKKLVGLAKKLGKINEANGDEFEDRLYSKWEKRFPESDA